MSQFQMPPLSGRRGLPLDYSGVGESTLGKFMNQVYAWMAAGLALTAVVAWFVSTQPQIMASLHGPLIWILLIAELVLVMAISAAINRISAAAATALFMLYAGLNGVTLSGIFLLYAHGTIFGAFIASAAMFAAVSVWGFFTQSDLSMVGRLAFMALIGIIVASVVNFFLHSVAMTWIISYIGVAVFIGLTAYDTQRLKMIGQQTAGNVAMANRLAISGALMLYLDFLNLFLFILTILGNGDRR